MTTNEIIRLLRKNWLLILGVGLATAAVVYFLTRDAKPQYDTKALVSTGVISAFSIETPGSSRGSNRDYILSELENLTTIAAAYETVEELAARLLTHYLRTDSPDNGLMLPDTYRSLDELPANELRPTVQAAPTDSAAYELVWQMLQAEQLNPLREVVYSDEEYFGIEYLQERIRVYRRGNSDLLEFTYSTTDPALCQRTLEMLIDIFVRRYAELKKSKTSSIVEYFADATAESSDRLNAAEQALLDFRTRNKIINYYEQTRSIAYQKEDLDELFFKEKMALEGSQASLVRVEEQLGSRNRLAELNRNLLDKRKELSELSTQLAKLDLMAKDGTPQSAPVRAQLNQKIKSVRQEISSYTREAYDFDQTPGGLNTDDLLNEWLEALMEVEQGNARLEVLKGRQAQFDAIYSQYAPWGSQIKRIEREIGLAEDAYLENLHSYNQAILHRENTLMASKLKVVDAPYYPKDSGTKRALFIVAGLLGGIVLSSASLLGLAFVDDSLRNPRLAAEKTGLPLAAVLPDFSRTWPGSKASKKYLAASGQAINLLQQQAKVELATAQQKTGYLLTTSLKPGEGKSFVSLQLANAMRQANKRVLFLYPIADGATPTKRVLVPNHNDNCPYLVNDQFMQKLEEEGVGWAISDGTELDDFDYVIFETPGLFSGWYPVPVLKRANLVLLVSEAAQSWGPANSQAVSALNQLVGCPVKLVVNRAPLDSVQGYLGGSFDQHLFNDANSPTVFPL